eukprot:3939672-Rhodomonas_salina.1
MMLGPARPRTSYGCENGLGKATGTGTLDPSPYPYTLHRTLHTTHYTLHPTPYTLHPSLLRSSATRCAVLMRGMVLQDGSDKAVLAALAGARRT